MTIGYLYHHITSRRISLRLSKGNAEITDDVPVRKGQRRQGFFNGESIILLENRPGQTENASYILFLGAKA
jgi:hypothetical protein